jgi:hypothetical protein
MNTTETSALGAPQPRTLKLSFSDGHVEEITLKQIPIKEYETATGKVFEEFALVAHATGKGPQWVYQLEPESYEELHAAVMEINERGFFRYVARRQETQAQQLKQMTPEMLRTVMESQQAASAAKPLRPARR